MMDSLEDLRSSMIDRLTTEAVMLSDDSPISKIIGSMRDLDVYEVLVECGERIGIVNVRAILEATDIASTKAGSIAVFPPKVSATDSVGRVSELMSEHRLRSLPIWEGRRVVGQITALSIMRSLADHLPEKVKASRVTTEDPAVVETSTSASTARNLMVRRRIDHLPVVEEKRPVGVLTSSHLVFNLRPAERLGSDDRVGEFTRRLNFPARELMDADIDLSHFNEPAVNLLRDMIKLGKTYSLVGVWGELQGIVTYRDFMKLLEARKQSSEIPISIVGLPQDPFESEVAKTKFSRVVSLLRRAYPMITEGRCTIKTSPSGNRRGRKRYEVAVSVKTPRDLFTYSEEGWELVEIFDVISGRMKRLLSQKRRRGARADLEEISSEEYSPAE